jgi:methionyl-tRNA formyltransferase
MILFLTNNIEVTKPLLIWLKSKDNVVVYNKKIDLKILKRTNPDLIISYNYRHIIRKDVLKNYKIINLHISYLPYNRGAHPNVWAYIDKTPVGVSIHYIDERIDTGDIIAQKRVVIDQNETLKSSYKKLHFHIQMLFKSIYTKIDNIKTKKQKHKGTFHLAKELENITFPKGWNTTIEELINENRKI